MSHTSVHVGTCTGLIHGVRWKSCINLDHGPVRFRITGSPPELSMLLRGAE